MRPKDIYQLYILVIGIIMFLAWKSIISAHPIFFIPLFIIPLISEKVTELLIYPIFQLGKVLSIVQKFIVLSIVYFVIILPISLIYKLSNQKKHKSQTNWKIVDDNKEINFKNLW
jgi:large-conductance mechanosensitive channel